EKPLCETLENLVWSWSQLVKMMYYPPKARDLVVWFRYFSLAFYHFKVWSEVGTKELLGIHLLWPHSVEQAWNFSLSACSTEKQENCFCIIKNLYRSCSGSSDSLSLILNRLVAILEARKKKKSVVGFFRKRIGIFNKTLPKRKQVKIAWENQSEREMVKKYLEAKKVPSSWFRDSKDSCIFSISRKKSNQNRVLPAPSSVIRNRSARHKLYWFRSLKKYASHWDNDFGLGDSLFWKIFFFSSNSEIQLPSIQVQSIENEAPRNPPSPLTTWSPPSFFQLANHEELSRKFIRIKPGILVSESSFSLLFGPNKLNDEIINALVCLCRQVSPKPFEHFTTLEVQSQERYLERALRNWRPVGRKQGISEDIVVMLLNWGNSHWGLMIFEVSTSSLFFYESTLGMNPTTLQLQTFQSLLANSGVEVSNFLQSPPQRLSGPEQSDSWSCGWWTVFFLECYLGLSCPGSWSPEELRCHVLQKMFVQRILTINTC
ncbi:MAG: hypothetical protein KDF65_16685, partial [Anaerolineae bacterium]|nr:hypothetical protein [Anaerolineae bacterium]